MADIDYFSAIRKPPPGAAPASATEPAAEPDYFAALRLPEKGWIEGGLTATANTGRAIGLQAQQVYNQLATENFARRAADRGKSYSDLLLEEQTNSAVDMQGKPIKTWTGGEYVSAAKRWFDAKWGEVTGSDDAKAADEHAAALGENMKALAATPLSQTSEKFNKKATAPADTIPGQLANFGGAILDEPLGALTWSMEQLARSSPSMLAGMATTLVTKNPAAGLRVGFAGSYMQERGLSPGEYIQDELKLDLTKPEDRKKLLSDPKLLKQAADRGVIRGLVIAAFDTMTGGLAGVKMLSNPWAEALAQTLTQAFGGGGGEAVAELAAGQKVSIPEILGEMLPEMLSLPFDMVTAGRGQEPPPAPGPGAPGAPGAVAGEEVIGGGETVPGTVPPASPLPELPVAPDLSPIGAPPVPVAPDLDIPPPPTPKQAAAAAALPQQIAEAAKVPDSEHLTPADRKSPIPNELIEEGKATIASATGQPSTFTTTQEINGKRTVVTGNVADLNAGNRAETSAVIDQIMAGVAPSPALAQALQAASPVSEEPVAGTPGPSAAPAAVAPLKIEGREGRDQVAGEDFSNAAHPRSEDTKDFNEWVQKVHAFSDARKAKAKEMVAASGGVGIPMRNKDKPNKRALVGPDMTEADRGKFRVTFVDEHGPSGHMVYNTFEEAAEQALQDGYVIDQDKVQKPLAAKVEAVRAAKAPSPVLPPRPEVRPIKDDVAITASGRDVPVTYAVIEADDLITSQRDEGGANPNYPQVLQPRDRSRGTSDAQIAEIANKLDPRLLDQNPNASDGAPIISEDGVVESGNGRVLGIRRAFNEGLATAKGYIDYLRSQGYPVDGMKRPVLVRIRKGDMKGADRQAFTVEANERTTLSMTATERAMADSGTMKPETVALYRGGDVTDAGNRDFVRSFMGSVNKNDRAAMVTPDGTLSQEGIRRVQGALLAKAYGDADLVGGLVESTDSNIKAIGGALMDVSGPWAQMVSEAKDGSISPEVDITPAVLEAVRLVQRARSEGRPLAEYVNQMDAFSGTAISPTAEFVLALMFRNTVGWTQPAGREKLAEALRYFTTEARKTGAGVDLLGETAPPANKILQQAKKRQYGQEDTQANLALAGKPDGKNAGAPSGERAVQAEPVKQAAKSPAATPKIQKSKLAKKVEAKRAEKAAPAPAPAPAAAPEVELTPEQAMAEQVRIDGERRARENAERKGQNPLTPKFQKEVKAQEPTPMIRTGAQEKRHKALKKRLYSQAIIDWVLKAAKIPKSHEFWEDGTPITNYGTPEFFAKRLYDWGKAGTAGRIETIDRLVDVARTLAVTEINDSRKKVNAKRAEKGLPPLEMQADYVVANERKAIILQGPPAAGKSSAANPRAVAIKAAIVDSDEAKKVVPGYQGGVGAGAVHTEAGHLNDDVAEILINQGANLVIPTVGANLEGIDWWRRRLQAAGYTVELSLVDPTPETASERMLSRFVATDRLIPPDIFLGLVWTPPYIYEHAKRLGQFDGYSRITTDDDAGTRVGETSGETFGLAVGDAFDRTGTIHPRGSDFASGVVNSAEQIQGEPEGSERLHIPPKHRRRAELTAALKAKGRTGAEPVPLLAPTSPERPVPAPTARPTPAPRDVGTTMETRQAGSADITYITTAAFKEKAAAVLADLRKRLDKYGLTGVDLSVWEKILVDQEGQSFTPQGQFLPSWIGSTIDLALKTSGGDVNLDDTLTHEVGHALFELALGDREISMLLNKAKRAWITAELKAQYPELTGRKLAEEAAVRAFVDWKNGAKMDGVITKMFKKLSTFLKQLWLSLTGHDLRTVEDIFRQMESGRIGRRTQRGGNAREITQINPAYDRGPGARGADLNFMGNAMRAILDKADAALSPKLQDVIVGFTGRKPGGEKVGRGEMHPELLEAIAKGEDPEGAAALKKAFAPIREALRAKYGDTVTLYRSQREVSAGKERATLSWSVNKPLAEAYVPKHKDGTPQGKVIYEAKVPLDQILWFTDRADEAEGILRNMPGDAIYVPPDGNIQGGKVIAKLSAEQVGVLAAKLEQPVVAKATDLFTPTESVDMFEGKRDQYVIPGAEKISNASLAQRRADAPLMAKRNQRDVGDLPLFSDEQKQMALFSKEPLKLGSKQDVDLKGRIEAAIDEVYSTLFTNPLNPGEVGFANKAQDKVVMMQLENYGDSLYVKWLSAYPQKGGMGTEGMKFLQKIAKKHNVPLSLVPWTRGEIGAKKLTGIFNKWGFKGSPGGLLKWYPAPYTKQPNGPNDPRFQLMQPPPTSQAAQQVMQGWLSRGQFLDRALRFPLDLIGGLDNVNNWKPGKRLNDKIGPAGRQGAGIGAIIGASAGGFVGGLPGAWVGGAVGGTVAGWILGSKAAPTGVFSWMAAPAEVAKRGLIDRYGLSAEYVKTQQKSELGKSAIMRQAQGILEVLSSAGVGSTEAKVLKDVLTGAPVQDADMIRLAKPIRQAIDALGAEAVSLGLISAESFQRNRGAYLHRVYTKNEIDTGKTMAGWVSKAMTKRRQAIIGDQLKGRGMFLEKPADRIMQDVDSFKAGKRGAPVLGEKFHVIDEVSTPAASMTPGAQPTEKVLRRVYLPANEAIPAKYSGPNWKDKGLWEVRKLGKNTTLWRDFTEVERNQMGELLDARYLIAKTFMLMANDLSTGRFFRDVAVNAEWTSSTPPKTKWKEASDYGRFWEDTSIEWVRVPDTNIADTGGKKRWGALSGKFVRAEIWRDLNEVNIANNPGTWRKLYSQWKLNKTARNPVVHMNNIMSNVMWMDLADVRAQDLIAGIRSYATSDKDFIEARDNGAFGTDMIAQEIRDNVLLPILEEIKKQQGVGSGATAVGFLGKAKVLGIIADKIWGGAKWVDNKMIRAYQAEDELFRMALYLRRRQQGESAEVAAEHARDQFLNYDIRAPWVIAMRQTLLPFVSYTYRAVPKLMESIINRPWKLAKYMAVAAAINSLSYMLDDWDDDDDDDGEERERAALRDEEQGYTWLGTPRMVRMPWRDGHGLPVFLDARRWVPAGDIFDDTQGHSAIPIPAPLQFGGPLALAFELKQNRSAFTGEDITNSLTDTNWDKTKKVADWAWKSWAPAGFWVPRSWYWTKIANSLYGATDTAGRPYSVPQAVLSSVGIKVKPVDVDDGLKWHFYDFKKVQEELMSQMRSVSGRYERGLISESAFKAEEASIMSKFENLGRNVDEFDARSRKPVKEPVE